MNVIRWIAFLSLLTALPFLARTEDGGHLDPNGRPSSYDGGGAMDPNGRGSAIDPNGYTACIDPNG
jgi:hypothetical protein